MRTRILTIALIVVAALLAACNKKPSASSNPVEQKLQELAGSSAKNCGTVKTVSPNDAKPATDCAMQSAQSKKPFYVSYELPGLTIAVAGNSAGKLFSVQQQSALPDQEGGQQKPATPSAPTVEPCPAELRVASSGRVTCYPAGSFGAMGQNPHGGGMAMPPGMTNPHGGGMSMPPAGTANPHGTSGMPSSHSSETKSGNAPAKPASKQ